MSEVNEASTPATGATSRGRGGRRVAVIVVLAMAVLATSVWGIGRWRYASTHVSTENAKVDGHIVPVLAKVGGYVAEVRVAENDAVHRGQVVAVIDDAELRVRLAEAEADLAIARAAVGTHGQLGQVQAEASAASARRQALEARLLSARAQRERAARDLARSEELAQKQIASSQQLDAARSAAEAAEAEVSAIEQEIAAARSAEGSAAAAVRAADGRLARAEAGVEQARMDLAYTKVAAPASGVVSKKQVEVGQLIQAGQPLAAVVGDSAVWVTANLKETETAEVRIGQDVAIEVDAYPGCTAEGRVESVSPATGSMFALIAPDNATGNFTKVVQRIPVRIAIVEGCGGERTLRPGMSVVAHIAVR